MMLFLALQLLFFFILKVFHNYHYSLKVCRRVNAALFAKINIKIILRQTEMKKIKLASQWDATKLLILSNRCYLYAVVQWIEQA